MDYVWVAGAEDTAEIGGTKGGSRVAVVGFVEGVESLEAEVGAEAIGEGELLDEADVDVEQRRTAGDIARGVAGGVDGLDLEGGGVEEAKTVDRRVNTAVGIADAVGAELDGGVAANVPGEEAVSSSGGGGDA